MAGGSRWLRQVLDMIKGTKVLSDVEVREDQEAALAAPRWEFHGAAALTQAEIQSLAFLEMDRLPAWYKLLDLLVNFRTFSVGNVFWRIFFTRKLEQIGRN